MSGSRYRENGRSYNATGARRHRKQLMIDREKEKRESEMKLLQYQQFQDQQFRVMMRWRLLEEQKRLIQQQQEHLMALRREIRFQATAAEQESRREAAESTTFSGNSSVVRTNIDRLVETVTPCVPARKLLEPKRKGQEVHEADLIQFYNLDDLWESYKEWSVYGAEVDLTLNGNENVTQYYVPSLSVIQLYVDPARARKPGIDTISQTMSQMSMPPHSSSTGDGSQSDGKLIFEYHERELPHQRKPLFDKISSLAAGHADLKKYRSCDLLPSSWISVAWYPIYRIPTGPSLKNLEASFLTFHHLSTPPTSSNSLFIFHIIQTHFSFSNSLVIFIGGRSVVSKMILPVFGLASYKLTSPILPLLDSEQRLSDSLFKSAQNWIESLHVSHPDYNFFLKNGKSSETNPN
ncbi:hypothetical protein QQ045_023123 [Rhodiola kirilowii]